MTTQVASRLTSNVQGPEHVQVSKYYMSKYCKRINQANAGRGPYKPWNQEQDCWPRNSGAPGGPEGREQALDGQRLERDLAKPSCPGQGYLLGRV